MKVKSASQTAGPLGKDHKWVGHFRNHLNAGHNDGPRIRGRSYEDAYPNRDRYRAFVTPEPSAVTMTDSAAGELLEQAPSTEYRVGRARGDAKGLERLGKALQRRQRLSGSDDI